MLLVSCNINGANRATTYSLPSETLQPSSTTVEVMIDPIGTDDVAHITKEDLLEKMTRGAAVLVVDTRRVSIYELEHIQDALNVPLQDIEEGLWRPPGDTEIVIYCGWEGEQESARVALILMNDGFFNVAILEEDLAGWGKVGYPLEGTAHSLN